MGFSSKILSISLTRNTNIFLFGTNNELLHLFAILLMRGLAKKSFNSKSWDKTLFESQSIG